MDRNLCPITTVVYRYAAEDAAGLFDVNDEELTLLPNSTGT